MTEEKKETKVSPWPWKLGSCMTIYDTEEERKCTDVPIVVDANGGFVCKTAADVYDFPPMEETCRANASLLAAAPELREELEKLVKRSCSMCVAEMKAAITPQNKPCEDGRPCPYGLDGAKKAIGKSYGRE